MIAGGLAALTMFLMTAAPARPAAPAISRLPSPKVTCTATELILGDPAAAKTAYDGDGGSYEPEEGASRAHTYHWIYTLATTGAPDTTVTADSPTAAAFSNGDTVTYSAHNYTSSETTVTFSDGKALTVPANSTATETG